MCERRNQSWVAESVDVRESAIDDWGLFAVERIEAGAVIIRFGGITVDSMELKRQIDAADAEGRYVDTIQVGHDQHLILQQAAKVHFGNHSCDPNLWFTAPLVLVARHDISEGEELTVDYGTVSVQADWSMTCTCGSDLCRGVISGSDWKIADLRQRYDTHWVPPALELISGS